MSDAERELVREALVWAGVEGRELDWMIESCPSVQLARDFAIKERARRRHAR